MSDPTNPMPSQQSGEPPYPPSPPEPAPPADGAPNQPGPPILPGQPEASASPTKPSAPPTRLRALLVWVAGGIAVAVVLVGGVTVINAISDDNTKPTASTTTPTAEPTPTTAAPTTAAPTTAEPSPTRTSPPPKPKPVTYKTLSERQWKLIAKDPDAYAGKTYIVYGVVTQFDSATGVDTFRADVGHKKMSDEYDYPTNTLLSGSEPTLKNLVEGDVFRAKVRVVSSFSYDTQAGGNTTVPLLQVDSIKLL